MITFKETESTGTTHIYQNDKLVATKTDNKIRFYDCKLTIAELEKVIELLKIY